MTFGRDSFIFLLNKFLPTSIVDALGQPITVQNPLACDGFSVHKNDIWVEQSQMGGFSGKITDLFDNLHSVVVDESTDNPKSIMIHFERTTATTVIALGSFNGDFSNVKITARVSGPVDIVVVDESLDNTKHTSRQWDLPPLGFNALKIEFYTTDTVTLSNAFVAKAILSVSRLQGLGADGSAINIRATDGGNMRVTVDQVDETTNSLKTISNSHAELHEGHHFSVRKWIALPKAGVVEFLVITPDTAKWAHAIFALNSTTSAVVADMYEDTVTSDDGIVDGTYNRNRNSIEENTTILYDAPVVVSDGNLIFSSYVGAGRGEGGDVRGTNEIILKQNTKYLVRITEQNITSTVINIVFDWYEHTNLG